MILLFFVAPKLQWQRAEFENGDALSELVNQTEQYILHSLGGR